ncbi:MAG TPA: 2-C-methyl-D-erythritol 2,4-cyclodiphosphate synthase [Gammaproteobacteria bacterium]|nr:2-C-methyl-D-erythritol 2,4-cyclodiphosphate synthase [Gammaproteobacteria bacterium]
MRIGQGLDVHAFGPGHEIVLGGVHIPHTHGIRAHSDGDVLLHAVCDALLGAAGLGDIGRHFPDSDPKFKGIDSRKLLCMVMEKVRNTVLRPLNVDVTLIAQVPILAPYIPAMCANLAADLGLPSERVNVKATTTERLGFIGRGEGIAAQVVVLMEET